MAVAFCGCSDEERYARYAIEHAPAHVQALNWHELLVDPAGDSTGADGKSLSYAQDSSDNLWFKLEQHNAVSFTAPAVSIAMDTDADQSTGTRWYGKNKAFSVDLMLSVGPVRQEGGTFVGYNGLTDARGIQDRNWVNVRQGNLTFYLLPSENAYLVGVPIADLNLKTRIANVIGSVGADARWRDDIGDTGFATITLNETARR